MKRFLVSAVVPACACLLLLGQAAPAQVLDTTTQGDWVGVYGGEGYVLLNHANPTTGNDVHNPAATPANDRTALPSYVSSYSYGGAAEQYVWVSNSADPRAVEDPTQTFRRATTSFTGSTSSITFDVNQARDFRLGIYHLDWDNFGAGGRLQTVAISVGGVPVDSDQVGTFQQGLWTVYDISAASATDDVTVTLTNDRSNAVLSAITFDAIPEPASLGLIGVGAVGLLARRRR